jgi:hypothetical protein
MHACANIIGWFFLKTKALPISLIKKSSEFKNTYFKKKKSLKILTGQTAQYKAYYRGIIELKYFAPVTSQWAAFRLIDKVTIEGMEAMFLKT